MRPVAVHRATLQQLPWTALGGVAARSGRHAGTVPCRAVPYRAVPVAQCYAVRHTAERTVGMWATAPSSSRRARPRTAASAGTAGGPPPQRGRSAPRLHTHTHTHTHTYIWLHRRVAHGWQSPTCNMQHAATCNVTYTIRIYGCPGPAEALGCTGFNASGAVWWKRSAVERYAMDVRLTLRVAARREAVHSSDVTAT
jgi:hypothetical protein